MFDNLDFEITKREIITSVSILAIMLILGVLIGGKINEYQQDQNAKYNKAFKIDKDKELFSYAMKTNVGNAFVEGELKAIKPVDYKNEVDGKYLVIEKAKERYTMHTRTVTYRDSKGRSHSRIKTYWTWDEIDRESKMADEVSFLGAKFKTSKFDLPDTSYIDTVSGGYHTRYKYYGLKPKFNATIFGNLKDNTIVNDNISVYENMNINETLDSVTENVGIVFFWILWVALIIAVIFLFMYLDNNWLNK